MLSVCAQVSVVVSQMRDYDENNELVNYLTKFHIQLFNNSRYSDLTHKNIAKRVPRHLKNEFHEYENKLCQPSVDPSKVQKSKELEEWYEKDELDKQKQYLIIYEKHKDLIPIPRCKKCYKILTTLKAKQCFWCGENWHQQNG